MNALDGKKMHHSYGFGFGVGMKDGISITVTGAHCGRNRIRDLLCQDPFAQSKSDYGQNRVDSRNQLIKGV